MNKLLSASFMRLKKDKTFWVGMALMFAFGAIIAVAAYCNRLEYGSKVTLDSSFFAYTMLFGIFSAAFCSLFIGTEYSDGTIRNKLVVGHKRSSIYLANLITCGVAGLLMSLSFLVAISAIGFPLLGPMQTDATTLLTLLLVSFMMVLAFTALFVLLAMLIQNKATAAVISLIFAMALLLTASYVDVQLQQPESFIAYNHTASSSETVKETIPNPQYLTDEERPIYQFILDFSPAGQSIQIIQMNTPNLGRMPLYSLLIILLSAGGGLFFFQRKDLK